MQCEGVRLCAREAAPRASQVSVERVQRDGRFRIILRHRQPSSGSAARSKTLHSISAKRPPSWFPRICDTVATASRCRASLFVPTRANSGARGRSARRGRGQGRVAVRRSGRDGGSTRGGAATPRDLPPVCGAAAWDCFLLTCHPPLLADVVADVRRHKPHRLRRRHLRRHLRPCGQPVGVLRWLCGSPLPPSPSPQLLCGGRGSEAAHLTAAPCSAPRRRRLPRWLPSPPPCRATRRP